MKKTLNFGIAAILNTYAVLFFSQNRVLGFLLLAASFIGPAAGLTGLLCAIFAIAIASLMGYHRETIKMGIYSFNTLLLGIGFGTFYHFSAAFFIWLAVAALLCLIITITLVAWLGKYNLPVLSLPFILASWSLLLAANNLYSLGLDQSGSYLLHEAYHTGAATTRVVPVCLAFINTHTPFYPALFFRALSAVLFQDNIVTGMIMSIGLLVHSRIGFSLLIIGFITACLFNGITGAYPEGISYYHLGANFMMTCCAMGGFFLVPSWRSYLWGIISILLVFLLVNALSKVGLQYNLPVFSLPFSLATLLLLYFFLQRSKPGKLQLTPLQHYSPERNLYQYLNSQERLTDLRYVRLYLPFMGKWTVTQGYDGDITHKADWGQALDLVIKDEDDNNFNLPGTLPGHFYCYNKPVLACADGIIQDTVDNIEDNAIGEVNMKQNWGNSIVIKHRDGLYSQVSHLKKNSLRVKPGDLVKQGDVLAHCGNSGRSPEPHLHFQVQATPFIGSKTMAYPFAWYKSERKDADVRFNNFNTPADGDTLSAIDTDGQLREAFDLRPGFSVQVTSDDRQDVFEVYTDAYNETYLLSTATGATAYFINNGAAFYFTGFYGDKRSLLYFFYLAAYKVVFSAERQLITTDSYPLQVLNNPAQRWAQDIFAPFIQFIRVGYQNKVTYSGGALVIDAQQQVELFGNKTTTMNAAIQIADSRIKAFTVKYKGANINATWHTENT